MASQGNEQLFKGIPNLQDAFVVIIKTGWNARWVDAMEKSCKKVLKANGVKSISIVVPGAVEIPFAIKQHYSYTQGKNIPDAYIALGTVIQGDTPHFDYVCKYATEGILQLNLSMDVPTIMGILTVNNEEQVKERVGGKHGNKGEEFALTALQMVAMNRKMIAGWK